MIDSIINSITDVCFIENIDVDRKVLHKSLLSHLESLLLRKGFDVHLEEPIFFNYLRIRDGSIYSKKGFIDLMAIKDKTILGIEFDSGNSLKNKSVEKLLQSTCNICIGIVRGNLIYTDEHNTLRIRENISKGQFSNKMFWLINLSQKTINIVEHDCA